MKPEKQNIVLGAGYVFVDILDADGNPTGRRYVGDTPGFGLTAESSNVEVFGSDPPIGDKLEDIHSQVNRSASIECRNISAENLALFLLGDAETVSQSSDSVTDEEHTGHPGRWIQLGATADDPVGARQVSNVAVTVDPEGTGTSASEGDDYTIEAETGEVYVVPGGAISEGDTIGIDYDVAEAEFDQITSDNLQAKEGQVFFRGDNTRGENRDVLIPLGTLRPSGQMAWKSRDTVASMTFNVGISTKGSLSQVYINGRPA